ncbi:DUF1572 family protein [Flavisolibacter tropicus]|uniref:DUF1572 domain-containing protein n=1 Tax=Flavisolibacter tropicus TaxID=1492898 RepID=A0A172U0K6_9BACT|nr:DUF1572 family protein [Flavisolibacter tropicus]ANE52885.1 hypothetical protein SY85_22785 [Flavisolibacter tropicus]
MIEQDYLDSCIKRFKECKALGDKTFAQLDEEQLNWQPNEASNNIAMIIQHLHGNMLSRWTNFLTEDGEKLWRNRDEEFERHDLSRERLLLMWEEAWQLVLDTLASLTTDQLTQKIAIRTESLTVVDAINRQLGHYSYHIGQIVFLGKWLLNNNWQTLSIPKGDPKNLILN